MDYNNLNDSEVMQLINTLKYPKNLYSFTRSFEIVSSLFGKLKIDESIIDEENDIEYSLHLYRGRLEESFSIHLRFKEFYHHLVRIDINPRNRHINPDGNAIRESHIHIYNNSYEPRDRVAIPLNESDFPNVNNLIDAFDYFLRYTHIKSKEGD